MTHLICIHLLDKYRYTSSRVTGWKIWKFYSEHLSADFLILSI